MKQTKKHSWFEMIPCTEIGDKMMKENEDVHIVQIEQTNAINEEGMPLMLCELVKGCV